MHNHLQVLYRCVYSWLPGVTRLTSRGALQGLSIDFWSRVSHTTTLWSKCLSKAVDPFLQDSTQIFVFIYRGAEIVHFFCLELVLFTLVFTVPKELLCFLWNKKVWWCWWNLQCANMCGNKGYLYWKVIMKHILWMSAAPEKGMHMFFHFSYHIYIF